MDSNINLYDENFFWSQRVKSKVKSYFGLEKRGPHAVLSSLFRGFTELGINYSLNDKTANKTETVCVLSGANILSEMLLRKSKGKVNKIIAGPNIAMPWEFGGIIFDKGIDKFLVPSQWVADYCLTFKEADKNKIKVWAAGVETLPLTEDGQDREECIIFYKSISEKKYRAVIELLAKKGIKYVTIRYGSFTHNEYIELLKKAKYLIYLTGSESQGLALHEAWMMDVPTLVWNGDYMTIGQHEYKSSSPAPYLTKACGMFFNDLANLDRRFEDFISQSFSPRQYHLQNFTDKITAQKYLEIINS